jgi:uncharacterized Zn-binding protein involved in type VI secretion
MGNVARIGDSFDCGDYVAQGASDVLVNGIPAARKGDATTGHGCFAPSKIAEGSATVFVNGKPLAYTGHKNVKHCCGPKCHVGGISVGSGTVKVE